jgi:integrase
MATKKEIDALPRFGTESHYLHADTEFANIIQAGLIPPHTPAGTYTQAHALAAQAAPTAPPVAETAPAAARTAPQGDVAPDPGEPKTGPPPAPPPPSPVPPAPRAHVPPGPPPPHHLPTGHETQPGLPNVHDTVVSATGITDLDANDEWLLYTILTQPGDTTGQTQKANALAWLRQTDWHHQRYVRGERPAGEGREKRILSTAEIGKLLDAAPEPYRVLLATAVFSGLRLQELLALRWLDVDRENGELHVRQQLSRKGGSLKPLKTGAGKRDVALMPELAAMLRRHQLASRHSGQEDFVFCSAVGQPLHFRNVQRRGMDKAVESAKLEQGKRDPTMHDLRHSFASLMIAQGLDVVFVSRQLGHANPATTLRVYASEFDRVRSADAARSALSAQFGSLLAGNPGETAARNGRKDAIAEVASLGGRRK